jgi:hypothetical protein
MEGSGAQYIGWSTSGVERFLGVVCLFHPQLAQFISVPFFHILYI